MKKIFLLAGIALLGATAFQSCKSGGGGSGDAVELKMNYPVGSQYAYVSDIKMHIEQTVMGQSSKTDNNMTMEFTYNIKDGANNGRQVDVTYDRVAMHMSNSTANMNMDYDSKDSTGGTGALSSMKEMVGKTFSMMISADGKIERISGLDSLMSSMSGNDAAVNEQMKKQFNDTAMRQMMQQSVDIYPGKPVKAGDEWKKSFTSGMSFMTLSIESTYKLKDVTNGVAHIDVSSVVKVLPGDLASLPAQMKDMKFEMNGTQSGTMDVEVATGMMLDSKMKQDIKGSMSMMGMSIPMTITSDIHIGGKKK